MKLETKRSRAAALGRVTVGFGMLEADEGCSAAARSLAAHILAAQESERKRVAQEMQASLAQAIVSTKMRADLALAALDAGNGDNARGFLSETVRLLQGALDEARRISTDLRPPLLDDVGLAAAISRFCRTFRDTHPQIDVHVQVTKQDVPEPLKTAIYRVLQEVLDNVGRHAKARHLLVVLRRGRLGFDLLVSDDGRGFDAAASPAARSGLGLAVMKERVEALSGSLTIESTPHRGTWVQARWPRSEAPSSRVGDADDVPSNASRGAPSRGSKRLCVPSRQR